MDIRTKNNNINSEGPQLKRISIVPAEEVKKLERDEIGIKSGLKGSEIKNYVDRAIYKLVYAHNRSRNITLKAIGKLNFNFKKL